jgi:hypothetical protein
MNQLYSRVYSGSGSGGGEGVNVGSENAGRDWGAVWKFRGRWANAILYSFSSHCGTARETDVELLLLWNRFWMARELDPVCRREVGRAGARAFRAVATLRRACSCLLALVSLARGLGVMVAGCRVGVLSLLWRLVPAPDIISRDDDEVVGM